MKGTVSVEHILPQNWEWEWVTDEAGKPKELTPEEKESYSKKINQCINGLGNLLLLTPGKNSSVGNQHPKDKEYGNYRSSGQEPSPKEWNTRWENSENWEKIIAQRGLTIFNYMIKSLIAPPTDEKKSEAVG